MRRKRKMALWGIGSLTISALLLADISKPPGSGTTKPMTGFDIAVVSVGTTGPFAESKWAPTATIKNVGTRRIHRDLQMNVKSNGTLITPYQLHVELNPGQTLDYKGQGAERDFAKPGDVVEIFIDAAQQLSEDNEGNNIMSRTIPQPFHAPPISTGKK